MGNVSHTNSCQTTADIPSNVADEFPSAKVIATDITPSQPNFVPPNVEFQIDDATMDWTFEPESFDFIHIRYLQGTIDDWDKFYAQVYKFLKPGAWFQHIEPDLQMYSQNPDVKVNDEQYVSPTLPQTHPLTDLASTPAGQRSSNPSAKRSTEPSTFPTANSKPSLRMQTLAT
jgi:SAM-dependent methyltransferase